MSLICYKEFLLGMELMPICAARVSRKCTLAQMEGKDVAETSIADVYEFLHSNIPEGKSLIYYTQPGIEGEIFGIHTAYNTLKTGGTCIFVVSSTSPCNIKNQFSEFGLDINPFKSRLLFVDAYNPLIGAPSKETYVISNPDNIYEFSKIIKSILKESPASTVVFGSLSTIMDLCGEKVTIDAVKTWNEIAAMNGHVLVYNFTAWPYSQDILDSIKNDVFNAVIYIGGMTGNTIFSQHFGILKSDWMNERYEKL